MAQFWRFKKRQIQLFAPLSLFVWSLLFGKVAGMGAVAFNGLIHNLLFLGKLPWIYDTNVHTPSYSISNSNM